MAFRIDPQKFYSPTEVAELFGMSERTLANWRWAAKGPEPTRLHRGDGARVFYCGENLLRYLREHTARWPAVSQSARPPVAPSPRPAGRSHGLASALSIPLHRAMQLGRGGGVQVEYLPAPGGGHAGLSGVGVPWR